MRTVSSRLTIPITFVLLGCGGDAVTPPPDRTPTWAHSFGDRYLEIAADGAGTVYALGALPAALDGTPLLPTATGQFLVAFDAAGNVTWGKAVAGVADLDAGGDAGTGARIALLGACSSDATPCAFDAGDGVDASQGLHLAVLDASGAPVWTRAFTPSAGRLGTLECCKVAAAPDGSVVVAGELVGALDLGGGTLTADAEGDLFFARFDAAGAHVWSRLLRAPGGVYSAMLGLDAGADGSVVILGIGHGGLDFGGGPLPPGLFLAELDAAGAHVRSRSLGTSVFVGRSSVSVSRDGMGGLAFTARVLDGVVAVGDFEAVDGQLALVKLDAEWALSWGRAFADYPPGRAVLDESGDLFFEGFGVVADDLGGVSERDHSYVVARFGRAGEHVWSVRFVESAELEDVGIVHVGGGVAIRGFAAGEVDFRDGRAPLAPGSFVARFPP